MYICLDWVKFIYPKETNVNIQEDLAIRTFLYDIKDLKQSKYPTTEDSMSKLMLVPYCWTWNVMCTLKDLKISISKHEKIICELAIDYLGRYKTGKEFWNLPLGD